MKMRICMVTDTDLHSGGGTNEVIFNLAKGLIERGHTVSLVAPEVRLLKRVSGDPPGARTYLFSTRPAKGLRLLRISHLCLQTVLQVYRREDFDILQQFHVLPLGPMLCILRRTLINSFLVSNLMGTDSFSPLQSPSYIITRPIAASVMNASDAVVAPSVDLAQRARENGCRLQIDIIPYGVDVERFGGDSEGSILELRRRLGIGADDSVILSVTRPASIKNVETLVRSAPAVLRAHPKSKFVLVGGDIENWSRMIGLSKSTGVDSSFRFVGPVTRKIIPSLYAMADVFVLTSLYESFGLSVLEAMAAGKTVVASKVGAIPEIVVEGNTGFLFAPRRYDLLAKLITKVLNDKELRLRMGKAGRKLAIENFSWNPVVDKYENLFQRLLTS